MGEESRAYIVVASDYAWALASTDVWQLPIEFIHPINPLVWFPLFIIDSCVGNGMYCFHRTLKKYIIDMECFLPDPIPTNETRPISIVEKTPGTIHRTSTESRV